MGLYYGTDSGTTSNGCVTTSEFYIGELGGALTAKDSIICGSQYYRIFETEFAESVIKNDGKVYSYWVLAGPNFANSCNGVTTNQEAYDWGVQQGEAAFSAWIDAYDAGYVNSITIFADIEQASAWGWSSNVTLNQQVLEGFQSQTGTSKGVYSAPCAWEEIMGSSYTLPSGTIEWTSEFNFLTLSSDQQCLPSGWKVQDGASCPSQTQAAQGFGGITPTIWQYGENPDVDAASVLPQ